MMLLTLFFVTFAYGNSTDPFYHLPSLLPMELPQTLTHKELQQEFIEWTTVSTCSPFEHPNISLPSTSTEIALYKPVNIEVPSTLASPMNLPLTVSALSTLHTLSSHSLQEVIEYPVVMTPLQHIVYLPSNSSSEPNSEYLEYILDETLLVSIRIFLFNSFIFLILSILVEYDCDDVVKYLDDIFLDSLQYDDIPSVSSVSTVSRVKIPFCFGRESIPVGPLATCDGVLAIHKIYVDFGDNNNMFDQFGKTIVFTVRRSELDGSICSTFRIIYPNGKQNTSKIGWRFVIEKLEDGPLPWNTLCVYRVVVKCDDKRVRLQKRALTVRVTRKQDTVTSTVPINGHFNKSVLSAATATNTVQLKVDRLKKEIKSNIRSIVQSLKRDECDGTEC